MKYFPHDSSAPADSLSGISARNARDIMRPVRLERRGRPARRISSGFLSVEGDCRSRSVGGSSGAGISAQSLAPAWRPLLRRRPPIAATLDNLPRRSRRRISFRRSAPRRPGPAGAATVDAASVAPSSHETVDQPAKRLAIRRPAGDDRRLRGPRVLGRGRWASFTATSCGLNAIGAAYDIRAGGSQAGEHYLTRFRSENRPRPSPSLHIRTSCTS